MNRIIKTKILPYLIYFIYRLYFKTIRYNEPKLPPQILLRIKEGKSFIVAHFHQDELALIPTRARSNFCVMTSTSLDGQMMKRTLNLMGYSCVDGSSSKGGIKALMEMIHTLNTKNLNAVMAVDGPKGPIYKVKEGVISLSKNTGAPILPVGVNISRSFMFKKSWNRALLPKPFSEVRIMFGEVISVPKDVNRELVNEYAKKLESELKNIKGL